MKRVSFYDDQGYTVLVLNCSFSYNDLQDIADQLESYTGSGILFSIEKF